VFLSAERVGLEATKKGLADNYTELTANQKAQLAYGLILKDTVKAQGDFGRTSDSLANRQRILKAQLEGVEAQLGEGLIPVFEDLADVAAETMDRVSAILNNDDLTGEQKFDRIMGVVDGLVQDGIEKLEQYMPLIAEAGAGLGGRLAVSLGKAFLASNIWGKLFIGLWLTKILLGGQGVKVMAAVAFHLAKAFGWKFLATVAPYFAAEMGVEGIGSALGSRMGGLKDMFGRAGGTLGKVMGTTWGKAFIATALVFGLAPLAEKIQDKLGLDDENSNLLETLTGEDVGGPVRDALGMEPDSEFGDFKGLNPGKGKRRRDGDRGPKGFRLPLTRTPALRPLGPQPAQRGGNKRVVLQIPIDGKVIAEKVLSQAELAAALQ
jgi:hypothetical protein